MNVSFLRLTLIVPAVVLLACSAGETQVTSVTVMSFNVQNLFDNRDDVGKDDKAYLPIEAKQDETHAAACNEIPVESWRDECLNLDWSNLAIEATTRAVPTE